MNILDHFDENPLPWYDKLVQAILNIFIWYKLGFSILATLLIHGILLSKVSRTSLEDLFLAQLGIIVLVSGLAGVIQWTLLFIGYIIKKITGKQNLLNELDFLSAFFLAAAMSLVAFFYLALIYSSNSR